MNKATGVSVQVPYKILGFLRIVKSGFQTQENEEKKAVNHQKSR
jgi:hypothetical protein